MLVTMLPATHHLIKLRILDCYERHTVQVTNKMYTRTHTYIHPPTTQQQINIYTCEVDAASGLPGFLLTAKTAPYAWILLHTLFRGNLMTP